jgi:hypothetical protein
LADAIKTLLEELSPKLEQEKLDKNLKGESNNEKWATILLF